MVRDLLKAGALRIVARAGPASHRNGHCKFGFWVRELSKAGGRAADSMLRDPIFYFSPSIFRPKA